MKILILSDSHAGLSFMRQAVRAVQPEQIVHLGDYYDDGEVIARENPHLRIHQVPGNCDRFRCPPGLPQFLCYDVGGVRMYMTHGHLHGVKSSTCRLIAEARAMDAAVVLYGHTHAADCRMEDGLWVLNPGSCGSFGGSVGVIETENGIVKSCRILRAGDF